MDGYGARPLRWQSVLVLYGISFPVGAQKLCSVSPSDANVQLKPERLWQGRIYVGGSNVLCWHACCSKVPLKSWRQWIIIAAARTLLQFQFVFVESKCCFTVLHAYLHSLLRKFHGIKQVIEKLSLIFAKRRKQWLEVLQQVIKYLTIDFLSIEPLKWCSCFVSQWRSSDFAQVAVRCLHVKEEKRPPHIFHRWVGGGPHPAILLGWMPPTHCMVCWVSLDLVMGSYPPCKIAGWEVWLRAPECVHYFAGSNFISYTRLGKGEIVFCKVVPFRSFFWLVCFDKRNCTSGLKHWFWPSSLHPRADSLIWLNQIFVCLVGAAETDGQLRLCWFYRCSDSRWELRSCCSGIETEWRTLIFLLKQLNTLWMIIYAKNRVSIETWELERRQILNVLNFCPFDLNKYDTCQNCAEG